MKYTYLYSTKFCVMEVISQLYVYRVYKKLSAQRGTVTLLDFCLKFAGFSLTDKNPWWFKISNGISLTFMIRALIFCTRHINIFYT